MNDQNRVPAGVPTGGQFTTTAKTEADVTLGEPSLPPAPLTSRDVEHLVDNRGRFQHGYDSDDVNKVLEGFEGANLVCVWDSFDDAGYGGDSEIVGTALDPKGPWRRIHPDVWEFLSDPGSDIDPESIPSLLDDDGDYAIYERQDIDELSGDGRRNLAFDDETVLTCVYCDQAYAEDGDGYDGFCPMCADLIQAHLDGEHNDYTGTDHKPDCPNCNGARVAWA